MCIRDRRQIGVRDETKMMGGIGICGRPLCCHSYMADFVPVSIKMAKAVSYPHLEEPPAYAVIMLLTPNADSFLQTIRSRCITINMKSVKDEVIKAYLMNEKHIPDYQADISAASVSYTHLDVYKRQPWSRHYMELCLSRHTSAHMLQQSIQAKSLGEITAHLLILSLIHICHGGDT